MFILSRRCKIDRQHIARYENLEKKKRGKELACEIMFTSITTHSKKHEKLISPDRRDW
jgi:hypothetical protein